MHNQINKITRLLDSLIQMAEDESLTGALSGGAETAIRRYNAIVSTLQDEDIIPDGLFEGLPQDASFASLGVEAKLLRSFLDDGAEAPGPSRSANGQDRPNQNLEFLAGIAPFARREDLGAAVRDLLAQGASVNLNLLTSLAPFLDQNDVGKLLRTQINLMHTPPAPPEPPPAPAPESAPPKPEDVWATPVPAHRDIVVADVSKELKRLGAELLREDISPERQTEVLAELTKLAHQKAIAAEFTHEE
jgi:hypothetical protein